MGTIRIALLSDDRLFSDGIVSILRTEPAFEVVTLAADRERQSITEAEVVLLDSRLEGALDTCARAEPAAVLLIAAPADSEWCRDALCSGASGVLASNTGAQDLIAAVRVVHEGSIWAPRRVMAACIRHLAAGSMVRRAGDARLEQHLSRREREIFHQAATGLANKELAARFDIGEATVKAHLTRIFQKLGVRGRAELAAVYHGVTPPGRAAQPPGWFPITPTPAALRRKSSLPSAGRVKK